MSGKPPEKRSIGDQIRAWGGITSGEARELIEQWRTENYAADEHEGLLRAADELEELLEERP